MKTQQEMYYKAVKKSAEQDKLFLFFINEGMTKAELDKLIKKRPTVWGKYQNFADFKKGVK
jgi:hypothetical protein